MENKPVSTISSSYVVITTLVYALIGVIFLESNNIFGEKQTSNANDINNDKTSTPELVNAPGKSPCTSDAEMCITMCA